MDNTPLKRRGRPPKYSVNNIQSEGADSDDPRDWKASPVGLAAQEDNQRPLERWCDFTARVTALYKQERRLRTVWHPWPEHDLIVTDWGNIRVLAGPYKGQLNNSDLIDL